MNQLHLKITDISDVRNLCCCAGLSISSTRTEVSRQAGDIADSNIFQKTTHLERWAKERFVLFSDATGRFIRFELDQPASLVWHCINGSRSAAQICSRIGIQHVSVIAILSELKSAGLITEDPHHRNSYSV